MVERGGRVGGWVATGVIRFPILTYMMSKVTKEAPMFGTKRPRRVHSLPVWRPPAVRAYTYACSLARPPHGLPVRKHCSGRSDKLAKLGLANLEPICLALICFFFLLYFILFFQVMRWGGAGGWILRVDLTGRNQILGRK